MRGLKGIIAFSAIMVVLTGCGKKEVATKTEPVRVKTIAVAPADISEARSFSGTVQESSGSTISFATAGTIQRMNVQTGDRVAKGQLIATVDDSQLRHAYDISKATLDEAQDAYNRMKKLHDAGSLPDMKWVEVENALRQAKSAEAIARKALNDAALYAPMSGYVADKLADAGQVVAPGIPVVKIVTIDPVKVNISVPENEIASINEGRGSSITVSALGGAAFSGKVKEKGVSANPLTRSYDVKIEVSNPEHRLLPGMICDVVLDGESGESQTAIVLPNGAVLLDADNRNFVWLAKDGHAHKQIVGVRGMTDSGLIIGSGVSAGDSVIVAGQQKVSENTPVVVI